MRDQRGQGLLQNRWCAENAMPLRIAGDATRWLWYQPLAVKWLINTKEPCLCTVCTPSPFLVPQPPTTVITRSCRWGFAACCKAEQGIAKRLQNPAIDWHHNLPPAHAPAPSTQLPMLFNPCESGHAICTAVGCGDTTCTGGSDTTPLLQNPTPQKRDSYQAMHKLCHAEKKSRTWYPGKSRPA